MKSSPVKLTYRSRGRRAALLPNTMTAKLVEQAAARHNIKRKAEEEGIMIVKSGFTIKNWTVIA